MVDGELILAVVYLYGLAFILYVLSQARFVRLIWDGLVSDNWCNFELLREEVVRL